MRISATQLVFLAVPLCGDDIFVILPPPQSPRGLKARAHARTLRRRLIIFINLPDLCCCSAVENLCSVVQDTEKNTTQHGRTPHDTTTHTHTQRASRQRPAQLVRIRFNRYSLDGDDNYDDRRRRRRAHPSRCLHAMLVCGLLGAPLFVHVWVRVFA